MIICCKTIYSVPYFKQSHWFPFEKPTWNRNPIRLYDVRVHDVRMLVKAFVTVIARIRDNIRIYICYLFRACMPRFTASFNFQQRKPNIRNKTKREKSREQPREQNNEIHKNRNWNRNRNKRKMRLFIYVRHYSLIYLSKRRFHSNPITLNHHAIFFRQIQMRAFKLHSQTKPNSTKAN